MLNLFLIILVAIVAVFWYQQKPESKSIQLPKNEKDDSDTPNLEYTLFALDTQHQQKIKLEALPNFPNHYGIIKGQVLEFSWQCINIQKIEIADLGFINHIGVHQYFKTENFAIHITLYHQDQTIKQSIYIHVFPVPVLNKIIIPTPQIQPPIFSSFNQSRLQITLPTIDIPSISQTIDHTAVPKPIVVNKLIIKQDNVDFFTTKMSVLNQLEHEYKDYKNLNNIIKDTKKLYI